VICGWWLGLAMRHPHEVYGLIHDRSSESRVGGGDVRRSGDIPCPRPDSFVILATVRGCCSVRSVRRVVPVVGTQRLGGMAVLEGHGDKEFVNKAPLRGGSHALRHMVWWKVLSRAKLRTW
jgi:hypothetical protein